MKSSIETLENNKVKVSVEVAETEFDKDLDVAFKRISKEIRLPGFRPGKAPRKVIEARIGQQYARDEAFREALPNYYSEAVKEHEVDVIASPEFDITSGEESGSVCFDAVVEVRPSIEVSGYDSFEVKIEELEATEERIDKAIDSIRSQSSELKTVDRAAEKTDRVSIDIETTHDGEAVPGFTTEAYSYEVGTGTVLKELDEQLLGSSAGDKLSFDADHPDEEEEGTLHLEVVVNEVQEVVLPETTPEWVSENSDFSTIEELREDHRAKITADLLKQAQIARRGQVSDQIAELVDPELVPEALVNMEADKRLRDMAMRLQAQGLDFEQFMQITGQDQNVLMDEVKSNSVVTAKLDLALRAIARTENISLTDEELEVELAKVAEQVGQPADEVREEFVQAGQFAALKADLVKSKTLDWLVEKANLVDENGRQIPSDALEIEDEDSRED